MPFASARSDGPRLAPAAAVEHGRVRACEVGHGRDPGISTRPKIASDLDKPDGFAVLLATSCRRQVADRAGKKLEAVGADAYPLPTSNQILVVAPVSTPQRSASLSTK